MAYRGVLTLVAKVLELLLGLLFEQTATGCIEQRAEHNRVQTSLLRALCRTACKETKDGPRDN
eukprot:6177542-Pleurochrysis_carterae.AAC.4